LNDCSSRKAFILELRKRTIYSNSAGSCYTIVSSNFPRIAGASVPHFRQLAASLTPLTQPLRQQDCATNVVVQSDFISDCLGSDVWNSFSSRLFCSKSSGNAKIQRHASGDYGNYDLNFSYPCKSDTPVSFFYKLQLTYFDWTNVRLTKEVQWSKFLVSFFIVIWRFFFTTTVPGTVLSECLPAFVPAYPSSHVHQSICPFIRSSFCPAVHLFDGPSFRLSVRPTVYPPVCPFIPSVRTGMFICQYIKSTYFQN
jgi:hypothetical protein